jgi:hypothetical protein
MKQSSIIKIMMGAVTGNKMLHQKCKNCRERQKQEEKPTRSGYVTILHNDFRLTYNDHPYTFTPTIFYIKKSSHSRHIK